MDNLKIGFPPNVLSEDAVRFDVLAYDGKSYIALNKPARILMDSYLGAPKVKSVMLAMRERPDKPEFKKLAMSSPYAVNQLDFEISGVSLIARDKDVAAEMRNAMWSEQMEFEYLLLTKSGGAKEEAFTIDLPVLKHEDRNVWIVSHRFGKKARTDFKIIETVGQYQLWSAKTRVARPHQIRLHAHEAKLNVLGEWLYSRTPPIFLSDLKQDHYKVDRSLEEERALYPHIHVHLSSIKFLEGNFADIKEIKAKLPKGFATTIKRLGFKNELVG